MLNRIINKIRYWYLSKNALPYWSVIFADFLIIVAAGLLSTYICEGAQVFIKHFWDRTLLWCSLLVFFFIGMRIFHTYNGDIYVLQTCLV